MRIEELLKNILRSFFVITTGIIISMYIFCMVFNPAANFGLNDIGRVLIMALASSLLFFIFYSDKELNKRQMLIRQAIHLPVLLGVLLFFAWRWDWVNVKNPKECGILILLIIGVYVVVLATNTYQDKKLADKLNDSLKKRYHS
ncbi:MAG: DUF3021 family protein [Eubacteriaceae bacterium]